MCLGNLLSLVITKLDFVLLLLSYSQTPPNRKAKADEISDKPRSGKRSSGKEALLDAATSAVGKAISGRGGSKGKREKGAKDSEALPSMPAPKVLLGKQGPKPQQQSTSGSGDVPNRGGGGPSGQDRQHVPGVKEPTQASAARQPSAREPRQVRETTRDQTGGTGQKSGVPSGRGAAESGAERSGSMGAAKGRQASGHAASGERRPKQEGGGGGGRPASSRPGGERGGGAAGAEGRSTGSKASSSTAASHADALASAAVTAVLQDPLRVPSAGGSGGGGRGRGRGAEGALPSAGSEGARDPAGRKVRVGFQAYVPRARPGGGDEGSHNG